MSSHHQISYLEFTAGDLQQVKKFYSEAFAWKFTDYGPEYVAFNDGSLDGGFAMGEALPITAPLAILYSENLEESLNTVKSCGGVITKSIFAFPGGRRFHFTDPGGNELAIWSDK
jgi:predicted enzyme related to lactoylglutathione lyase